MLKQAMMSMNLLAFDTSGEVMSLALVRDTETSLEQLWQHTAPGGAQTSTQLIPAIAALMAQAGLQFSQLDAIVFGCGPGSFTGLRTACSVAQGLAFGAGIPVLPVDTLLALAEQARAQEAPELARWSVMALLDARMDEIYAGRYVFENSRWSRPQAQQLLNPEQLQCAPNDILAGNVFATYGARLNPAWTRRVEALPTASALLRLAPALLASGGAVPASQALPMYIRDKVAKTTLERLAEKALP